MHALAGVDDRPLRVDQDPRHLRRCHRVGRGARPERRRVADRFGHVLLKDVDRHLDEDGPRPAVLHLGEGPPHDVRDLAGERHLLAPLGDVAVVQRRVEVGRDIGEPTRVAAGQDHDGHRVAVGLGHAAEAVLGARAVLHGEDADLLAGGDAAHGVRHVQPDALLPHDDGADVGLGGRLEDGVDGIADEKGDSLALQDLRDGGGGLHGCCLLGFGIS